MSVVVVCIVVRLGVILRSSRSYQYDAVAAARSTGGAAGAAGAPGSSGGLPPPSANATTKRLQQTQAQVAEVGFVPLSPIPLLILLGFLVDI